MKSYRLTSMGIHPQCVVLQLMHTMAQYPLTCMTLYLSQVLFYQLFPPIVDFQVFLQNSLAMLRTASYLKDVSPPRLQNLTNQIARKCRPPPLLTPAHNLLALSTFLLPAPLNLQCVVRPLCQHDVISIDYTIT